MSTHQITLNVNGHQHAVTVDARQSLADTLRNNLGLTGTHLGCEHGVCGACTVHVNGEAIRSCVMLAVQAEDLNIRTIEGVSQPTGLNRVQDAMHRHHALQCGFCTPGMVMALQGLFDKVPSPDEEQIRDAISGNICRCTGYQPIIAAALELSKQNQST